MAELADALVLGSSVYDVQVQVLLSALNNKNPNLFSTGERVRIFGFLQQSKMKIQMNAASRFFSRDAAGVLCFVGMMIAVGVGVINKPTSQIICGSGIRTAGNTAKQLDASLRKGGLGTGTNPAV